MKQRLIVHVTPQYPPYLGGLPLVVQSIASEQAKRGHRVLVLTTNIQAKQQSSGVQPDGVSVIYLKSFTVFNAIITPGLLFRLIALPKSSIIHVHVGPSFTHDVVWFLSLFNSMKYIAHVHGELKESHGLMSRLLPLYKKVVYGRVINTARKIIVPTKEYMAILTENYGTPVDRITAIPNAVDYEFFSQASTLKRNPALTDRNKHLVFAGRLAVEKDIPLLINAVKILEANKGGEYNLTVIGEGPECENLMRVIHAANLTKLVSLPGRYTKAQLRETYSKAFIFILPSVHESWGLSLVEAMSAGLPVIATNIPGVREIVQDRYNGILVERNSECLAAAISNLSSDEVLYSQLKINGQKSASKYTWGHSVDLCENVYDEIYN